MPLFINLHRRTDQALHLMVGHEFLAELEGPGRLGLDSRQWECHSEAQGQ